MLRLLNEKVFVKDGSRGGHEAAHKLYGHLKDYFRTSWDWKPHWKVSVRIFANLTGLVKAYYDAGVVTEARVVREFLVGFNRELPFFEFIDAGSDKEAADNKIKGNHADTQLEPALNHWADCVVPIRKFRIIRRHRELQACHASELGRQRLRHIPTALQRRYSCCQPIEIDSLSIRLRIVGGEVYGERV